MKTIEEMKSFPAARKNYRPEKVEKLSEVWHVYSLGSIFDARKRGMGADE